MPDGLIPVPVLSHDGLAEIARALDDIAAGAVSTTNVRDRLSEVTSESGVLAALSVALLYSEQTPSDLTACFGPMMSGPGWQSPPALETIPQGYLSLWNALAALVSQPILRARLHDLCFVTSTGTKHLHATEAASAYIELARRYQGAETPGEHRLLLSARAYNSVARAHALARGMNQLNMVQEAMDTGVELAALAVEDPDARHGTVCHFLTPFIDRDDCPFAVDAVLTAAQARFGNDEWAANDLAGLQVARAKDEREKSGLRRKQVENIIALARRAEPLAALRHLHEAERLAGKFHLDDLSRQIRVQLQEHRKMDLGMQRFETRFSLDGPSVERWLSYLREQSSPWNALLAMITSVGSPTGRPEENDVAAEAQRRDAPLLSTMGRMTIGPDNSLRDTSEDDEDLALRDVEVLQLQLNGIKYVLGLRAILDHWGDVSLDDAQSFFCQAPHVDEGTARRIGDCLNRLRASDWDGATSLLIQRIERLAREALIMVGEPVTKPGAGGTSRDNYGLGRLIDLLEERGIDPAWATFLRVFLVGSLNIRNDSYHGNLDESSEQTATLLIVAATYLAALTFST